MVSPPLALDARQWRSCSVGAGTRYALSVWRLSPSAVSARFAASTRTATSKTRP
jgi:hypothetical protein